MIIIYSQNFILLIKIWICACDDTKTIIDFISGLSTAA